MKLIIATSEAVPYIKTGGLGDIAGTLAIEHAKRDHEVWLALPLYKQIDRSKYIGEVVVESLPVQMGNQVINCRVWITKPMENLSVFFFEHNEFFNRDSLYGDYNTSYQDNGKRFAFFSKAILDLAVHLNYSPDIIHANDWQTALTCYYLKTWYWRHTLFEKTASVLSIHNIGYQGQSDISFSAFIGLNWMQNREDEFESLGGLNFLKGAFFYADQITTVSPTYAREILSEPGGAGLSAYLRRREDDIVGILNGIDVNEWNPATDPFLPANYSKSDLSGKQICKTELQKRFDLKIDPAIPIFGMVGRLVDQKGVDLLMGCIRDLTRWKLQLVILGDGNPFFTSFFGDLPKFFSGQIGSYIGFSPELAHLIEAGGDFFLMPSRYEPCGLNQMYSLVYGTLPIVRATGGLNDTVINFDSESDTGTGFVFNDMTVEALKNTIGWALHTWHNHRENYRKAQIRAMSQDFTWKRRLEEYDSVYQKAIDRKKNWY